MSLILSGCSTTRLPEPVEAVQVCELVCPADLGELQDDSFGATSRKLLEVIGVYRECRQCAVSK